MKTDNTIMQRIDFSKVRQVISKNHHSLMVALLGIISVSLLTAMVTLTTMPQKDWQAASEIDTVEAYVEFIHKWPTEIHVQYAKAALNKLEEKALRAAEQERNVAAYENFLSNWPEGRYVRLVERRLAELQSDQYQ